VYCAPELSGTGPGSHSTAADAYAFGVLAWELCDPRRVAEFSRCAAAGSGYDGAPSRLIKRTADVLEGMPLNLELLVLACLSAEPAERPSLDAAAEVVQSVLTDLAALVSPPASPGLDMAS
jgi:hypothetical protein